MGKIKKFLVLLVNRKHDLSELRVEFHIHYRDQIKTNIGKIIL